MPQRPRNLRGLGQARAGKCVGLVPPARTIMSLPFPCNGSSQRSVSTVVLIKPRRLPVVSGTWHFSGRSMCCTHTLSLRFLGSIKLYSHSVQALNTNIFDLHMAYCSLKNPLFSVGTVSPELPGRTELWAPERVGIFRCSGGMISLFLLSNTQ